MPDVCYGEKRKKKKKESASPVGILILLSFYQSSASALWDLANAWARVRGSRVHKSRRRSLLQERSRRKHVPLSPLPLSPVHEEEFKQSASAPFIAKTNRQHVAQVGRLVEQTAL